MVAKERQALLSSTNRTPPLSSSSTGHTYNSVIEIDSLQDSKEHQHYNVPTFLRIVFFISYFIQVALLYYVPYMYYSNQYHNVMRKSFYEYINIFMIQDHFLLFIVSILGTVKYIILVVYYLGKGATGSKQQQIFYLLVQGMNIVFISLLGCSCVVLDQTRSSTTSHKEHWLPMTSTQAGLFSVAFTIPLLLTVFDMSWIRMVRKQEMKSKKSVNNGTTETMIGHFSIKQIVLILKPYFWPKGTNHRIRACSTYIVLGISKVANLSAPLYMASATNALVSQNISLALNSVGIYCLLTFISKGMKELQAVIYLGVKQTAYIELATLTYSHLHNLSLEWHLKKVGCELYKGY